MEQADLVRSDCGPSGPPRQEMTDVLRPRPFRYRDLSTRSNLDLAITSRPQTPPSCAAKPRIRWPGRTTRNTDAPSLFLSPSSARGPVGVSPPGPSHSNPCARVG